MMTANENNRMYKSIFVNCVAYGHNTAVSLSLYSEFCLDVEFDLYINHLVFLGFLVDRRT